MAGRSSARPDGMMTSAGWRGAGGLAGLLFVAIFLVFGAGVLAGSPRVGESAEVIRQWAIENGQLYLASMWVAAAMHVLFLLPFAIVLADVIGSERTEDRVAARLVVMGAVASAVTSTVGTAFSASLTLGSAAELPDASVTAFWRADGFIFLLGLNTFQALMVGGAGLWALRTGGLPRWLGALGVIDAVALVAAGLWVVGARFDPLFEGLWLGGLAGYAAWVALAGGVLLRTRFASSPVSGDLPTSN